MQAEQNPVDRPGTHTALSFAKWSWQRTIRGENVSQALYDQYLKGRTEQLHKLYPQDYAKPAVPKPAPKPAEPEPKPATKPATKPKPKPTTDIKGAATKWRDYYESRIAEEAKKHGLDKDTEKKVLDESRGILLQTALRPTHTHLTTDEINTAHRIKAAKLNHTDSLDHAKRYLDDKMIGQDEIDTSLSNDQGLVIKKPNGKVELVFRGTDLRSPAELKLAARIAAGFESGSDLWNEADDMVGAVKAKYGANFDHIAGYSAGATKAYTFGQKYNIDATGYSPLIGANQMRGKANTTAKMKVIRTTEDPASLGLAFSDNATHENWEVKSINPMKNSYSPINAHKLENYTGAIEKNMHPRFDGDELMQKAAELNGQLAQYDTMHAAMNDVNAGKSYTEFVHHTINNGSGGDTEVLENGELRLAGTRNNSLSNLTRAWVDAGGRFKNHEVNHLSDNDAETGMLEALGIDEPVHYKNTKAPNLEASEAAHQQIFDNVDKIHEVPRNSGLSKSQRDAFVEADPIQRLNIMDKHRNVMIEHQQAANEHFEPAQEGITSFTKTLHPSNLARGFIAGSAARTGIDFIDPHHSLNPYAREAIEGAATGAATAATGAALTGAEITAGAIAPEMAAGAIGYVAQDVGGKLLRSGVAKLGGNKDEKMAAQDIGGGIIGGAAAGAAAGSFVPGLGTAAGAGYGATIGAAGGTLQLGIEEAGGSKEVAEASKDIGEGALGGAGLGAAVGSVVPGLGTAVGAAVGAGLGTAVGIGSYLIHKFW